MPSVRARHSAPILNMSGLFNVLARLRQSNKIPNCFIDVGAHFGESYDEIYQIYPNSKIICFEANPACEQSLRSKNLKYNICLLGDTFKEKVPFFINPDDITSTGCSLYQENTTHFKNAYTIDIPMYRLDEKININGTGKVFLKIDVQGAELDVLNGSTKLFPLLEWVYLEVSFVEYNKGSPLVTDVLKYMFDKNYRLLDIGESLYNDSLLIQSNFLFEKQNKA